MFTGIVTDIGEVSDVKVLDEGVLLRIDTGLFALIFAPLPIFAYIRAFCFIFAYIRSGYQRQNTFRRF